MCSSDILVISEDRRNLTTEFLKYIWMSLNEDGYRFMSAMPLVLQQADLQDIGHCCSCGIAACNENVDNLVSNKTYILMLSV